MNLMVQALNWALTSWLQNLSSQKTITIENHLMPEPFVIRSLWTPLRVSIKYHYSWWTRPFNTPRNIKISGFALSPSMPFSSHHKSVTLQIEAFWARDCHVYCINTAATVPSSVLFDPLVQTFISPKTHFILIPLNTPTSSKKSAKSRQVLGVT